MLKITKLREKIIRENHAAEVDGAKDHWIETVYWEENLKESF